MKELPYSYLYRLSRKKYWDEVLSNDEEYAKEILLPNCIYQTRSQKICADCVRYNDCPNAVTVKE